eukprot:gene25346-30607_t
MSFKCFLSWVAENLAFEGDNVSLFGHPVEQVWVQGLAVMLDEENQELVLDDGTATIVIAYPSARMLDPPTLGSYISVQGVVILGEDESGEERSSEHFNIGMHHRVMNFCNILCYCGNQVQISDPIDPSSCDELALRGFLRTRRVVITWQGGV